MTSRSTLSAQLTDIRTTNHLDLMVQLLGIQMTYHLGLILRISYSDAVRGTFEKTVCGQNQNR